MLTPCGLDGVVLLRPLTAEVGLLVRADAGQEAGGGDAQVKAETMRTLWVPGVNNLGTFGRWRFEEFTDVLEIEAAFAHLMDSLVEKAQV